MVPNFLGPGTISGKILSYDFSSLISGSRFSKRWILNFKNSSQNGSRSRTKNHDKGPDLGSRFGFWRVVHEIVCAMVPDCNFLGYTGMALRKSRVRDFGGLVVRRFAYAKPVCVRDSRWREKSRRVRKSRTQNRVAYANRVRKSRT